MLEQLANTSSRHLSLSLITVLPEKSSAASQSIISELESYVNMTYCIHRENITEPASSYIIKSQSTDSRTIVNYNELPDMTVDEFTRAVSKLGHKATWFHFEVG